MYYNILSIGKASIVETLSTNRPPSHRGKDGEAWREAGQFILRGSRSFTTSVVYRYTEHDSIIQLVCLLKARNSRRSPGHRILFFN